MRERKKEESQFANTLSKFINEDDEFVLYDNLRYDKDSTWHEQIIVVGANAPAFDLKTGDIGLGNLSADLFTGGWETDHLDISALDFVHAEAGAHYSSGSFQFGAMGSLWSPSVSFSIWDLNIELGFEAVSIGAGIHKDIGSFELSGSFFLGGTLKFEWA